MSHLPDEFYKQNVLSSLSNSRSPNPIRGLLHLEQTPGIISLLAGKPNPAAFPITSISFTASSPVDGSEQKIKLNDAELASALQYTFVAGIPALVDWLTELQVAEHSRPRSDAWRLSVGSGSQDLIYKAFLALLNRGDPVFIESPVYPSVLPICTTYGFDPIQVDCDDDGISTAHLEAILDQWPAGKPKPRTLYTVPYGCNPTGTTTTLARRTELLALARKHDFLILEDDPYFSMYYGTAPRPPSYFQLDAADPAEPAGRVLRCNSLSKVLAAGLRIGFVSGPRAIISAIDLHASTSTTPPRVIAANAYTQTASANLQASSTTQVIAHALLSSWGIPGFRAHAVRVAAFYKAQRDGFARAMVTHFAVSGVWGARLAQWAVPQAGMFFWFTLVLPPGRQDAGALVRDKAFAAGVLALPGSVFIPHGGPSASVRASFSLLGEPEFDEALRRLASVVKAEWDAVKV